MAPGTSAALPLIVEDAGAGPDEVSVSVASAAGLDVTVPERLHDTGNDTLAGWVEFSAPEDLDEGEHTVTVSVEGTGQPRNFDFTLDVKRPTETIEEGQQVETHVSGRTRDGELVLTTQAEIADARLPHSENYQEPAQTDPLPLPVARGGQLPEEIVDALLASGEGLMVTVEVPEFYGPETIEDDRPREETVQRHQEEQRSYELPREQAEQQGIIPPGAEEGDPVEVPGLPLSYVIGSFRQDEQQGEMVEIVADVQEGDTLTLDEAWPEAVEVVEVVNDTVRLYTTPPYEPGQRFTWVDGWEDATEIVEMDDDTILLRHTPEEGLTYTEPAQRPGAEPTEVTVVSVGDESITVSRENPDPLAGQTILLDLTIVSVAEPEAPPMQPGPGDQGGQPQP